MRPILAFAFILGALLVGGCSEGEGDSTAPSGDDLLVTYTRSGGLAPIFEEMTIEADGDAVLTTGGFRPQDQEVTEFTLEDAELTALTDAVANGELEAFEPGTGVCADCYEYSIVTADAEVRFSDVDLDDEFGGVIPEGVTDLIAELNEVALNHAPPIADDARGTGA